MIKTFIIKIPKSLKSIFFSTEYKLFTAITKCKSKITLKIFTKFFILKNQKFLLTNIYYNSLKKKVSLNFNLLKVIFKRNLKTKFKVKLKLNGIGFKFFELKKASDRNFLKLKIGYSHFVFYKIPKKIEIYFLKPTYIILSSNYYQLLTDTVINIRKFKLKEPYKGKGIFYENELIKLKQTKT